MTVLKGQPIIGADIEQPLLAILPEYAGYVVPGGLQGKEFIKAGQDKEYVLGGICVDGTNVHALLFQEAPLDVPVDNTVNSDGVVVGNDVCAPLTAVFRQSGLQLSNADVYTNGTNTGILQQWASFLNDLRTINNFLGDGLTHSNALMYGWVIRTFNVSGLGINFDGFGWALFGNPKTTDP